MCDNARFRKGQKIDEQYIECEALIPTVEEKVNKDGDLTLNCEPQSTGRLGSCFWFLPDVDGDGEFTTCEVRTYRLD